MGHVYLLWDPTLDRFKIGWTSRAVEQRKREIEHSLGLPLEIIGRYPGTRADERVAHDELEHLRIVGEWFRRDDSLVEWITRDPEALAA